VLRRLEAARADELGTQGSEDDLRSLSAGERLTVPTETPGRMDTTAFGL
jgi:hypothetical protein